MLTKKRRYYCHDCKGVCSRGHDRCKGCAAKHRAVSEGRPLVVGVSRDEDYRPTVAELVTVERKLQRLQARRRYTRRPLTVEEIWSQQGLPVDQEYASFAGARP